MTVLQQLLWVEVVLKGAVGLLLLALPVQTARLCGLPNAGDSFWARVSGTFLLSIAMALLLQGSFPAVRTLTPAGLMIINLSGACTLIALQVLGKGAATRRGRLALWSVAVSLLALTSFEIAFA